MTMPIRIEEARDVAAADAQAALAGVNRLCDLDSYDKRSIPTVSVRGDIIAYASPDSTYAVTKTLFDAATKSILIGIYDFSASHIRQLVLDAMVRRDARNMKRRRRNRVVHYSRFSTSTDAMFR